MELKDKKITVTGGAGFLGSYVVKKLKERGVPEENIFVPDYPEYDLRIMGDCQKVVAGQDIVIHLAAKVGGIGSNREHPGSFYYDNLIMGAQLMEAARLANVKKFVALGTICAYPKFTPTPFKEENLWEGYPEETNAPYGLAKKMMLVQSQAYRQEYGFNSIFLLPVNLYGPRDNFNPNSSHVIPALIKKIHEAKEQNLPEVEVWGTGAATREFLFADDAAEGIILATEHYEEIDPVNIGSGMEISIKDLVTKICQIIGYQGNVRWNHDKPDGQPRRMLDVSRAKEKFGFQAKTTFDDGLRMTIDWYREQQMKKKTKKALITGITGQDGSYLAELLLEKGYEVHGIIRRSSSFNTGRIDHIYKDVHEANKNLILHFGDLSDSSNLSRILTSIQPDEIYNLGAQSHVRVSFDTPEYTADVTGLGTLRILDAIKESGIKTRFYQASSSEMFGQVQEVPQRETTPFYPRSPYGCAKVFGYWITKNYRESYALFACNGILFNHESERRGETFVTRKITRGLARIKIGRQDRLYLGNLDAKRDWGYAKDYVEAMWLMLQQDQPDDYVVATGETHTVREFIEECAKNLDINLIWQGSGLEEKGIDAATGKTIIEIDSAYFRPTEVELLIGDSTKAKQKIGWEPKTKFKELVKIMTEADWRKEKDNQQ